MKGLSHPTEPPPARGSWRAGEMTGFGAGRDAGSGYMGYSERVGPGVLVLHEAYGLTDGARSYVDRLAEEGFTALAPDLLDGHRPVTFEEALDVARSVDTDAVSRIVRAAAEHLTSNWHPRLGIVGFSWGGKLATIHAPELQRDATVVYYSYGGVDPQQWSGPLLGHFAAVDDLTPPDEARALWAGLEASGHDAECFVYDGTMHSFANPDVPDAYNEVAAELAWERTLESLYYYLS